MSLASKILWGFFVLYIGLGIILALSDNILSMFIADSFAIVFISVIGLQFIITVINSFMSGLSGNKEKEK